MVPVATVSVLVLVSSLAGCTAERGESSSADSTVPAEQVQEVTIPPERRTPFCAIMIDLDLNIPVDPVLDVTDEVLDAYRRALPVAPAEIAVELEAVIIGLETGTDPTLPPTIPTTVAPTTAAPPAPATATTDADGDVDGGGGGAAGGVGDDEDDFAEEGYLPDDSPEARLNEFVDFHCRDNINNPGPPATPPAMESSTITVP